MKRTLVALNPPRRVADFLFFAKTVAACLSEDPLFSPPASQLATLVAGVAALEATLVAVLMRKLGAAAARKARQSDVLAALHVMRTYVQTLASTMPADEAAMVAVRAGMAVKDAKGPKRPALMVKAGRVSGSAHAYAPAAKRRAGYEWQVAREGAPWVSLPFTMRADVELSGFEPGSMISVRARAVMADGPSDWLGPARFLVG
jgi:hypothetical protein